VNEQVIHVDNEPSFINVVSEEMAHKHLECGRGVAKTKKHDGCLEEAKGGNECCLPMVLRSNQHIVVSPVYVHFGKNAWPVKSVDEVRDEQKRVGVFDGMGVDILVVLAGTYHPILLGDEEEGWHLGGLGRLNLASGKVFVYKAFTGFMFLGVQRVYFGHLRHKASVKVNSMVEGTGRGELLHVLFLKDPLESFEGDR
jgi:hypothetical protein